MSIEDLEQMVKSGRIIGKANVIFSPEVASRIGAIHGSMFKPADSIVMARDFNNDSRMLKRSYAAGVMSTGVDLLNLSVSSFPLLQFTIRRFGASGGCYFSSGHLYSEDVGVRFINAGGIELAPNEIQKFISDYSSYPTEIRRVAPDQIGTITSIPQTYDIYIKSLQQFINKKKIKDARLKIVIDCSYGPTGRITPILLNEIGVEVIALNTHYRQRSSDPVPNINSIRNTAEIVKASNSHLGVCFDVDGSRILLIDENGLEVGFEELLMLFIAFDERIQGSKSNTIVTTPSISNIVKKFIKDNGFPLKQVPNLPGELSRQIREERACFAAADTLKFYFPQYSPFSDGNFILFKILEIMTAQNDLLSSLTRGFPKGSKVNKTVPISDVKLENFHNRLLKLVEENGYQYLDIINELKILGEGVTATIKVALNRNAILLSAESENAIDAKALVDKLENLLIDMK